jgi:hypothetical protein
VTDLALFLQSCQSPSPPRPPRPGRAGGSGTGRWPPPQAAQAGLALAPDRIGLQAVADLALPVPDHAALGEDVRATAQPPHGAGDDLLAVAQAVNRRGVDPVDASVQRLVDGGDGVARSEFPSRLGVREPCLRASCRSLFEGVARRRSFAVVFASLQRRGRARSRSRGAIPRSRPERRGARERAACPRPDTNDVVSTNARGEAPGTLSGPSLPGNLLPLPRNRSVLWPLRGHWATR